jgi:hypothetical protein
LSQELNIKAECDNGIEKTLEEVRALISDTEPHDDGFDKDLILKTYEDVREKLDSDFKRVYEVGELLFSDDISAYGERCTSVFKRWDEEGGGPSILSIIVHALGQFNLTSNDYKKACFLSCILADVPNDLQYHGNEHYKKVLFHLIRLIKTHNHIVDNEEEALSLDEIVTLILCGVIHDLGHQGGDNLRDGIYTPGYMEQRSIDIAFPYLNSLELSDSILADIETLVFCTDITFFAGENSPCVRMRKIYDYFYGEKQDDKVLNYMMGKLRRFEDNKKLALLAMLLHEADIGSSAGLSYEQSIKETIDIIEERGMKSAGPRVLLTFMQEQLEGGMKTPAAKTLFGTAMEKIMAQAVADMEAGKSDFYS